ncbi:MAG: glycosyltransferase family 39 protein [Candidatus Promineifilaceae bacterium]
MRDDSRIAVLAIAAGYLATCLLLVILRDSSAAQIPAFILLWIIPAVSWFLYLDGLAVERLLIASGLSLLLVALLVLVSGYLPGDISPWYIVGGLLLMIVPPLQATWRRGTLFPIDLEASKKHGLALGALVLIALFLRLTNLGYKEFQGDEGIIMVRAASILTGVEGEVFLHQKGPVEILLPAATWALAGTIDDYWSRLPFTWAGILEVVAIYWLARIWFGRKAGVVAGLLFAVAGFGIAFSRIVQYQNLVMLWGTLALITATRYRESGRQRHLLLTSAFLAAGLLAHYDAVLVLPAVLWILCGRLCRPDQVRLKPIATSLLLGAVVVGVFYLPFALSPNASRTLDYLLADRVTVSDNTSLFGWSGPAVWQMLTFYNSIWYVLGILLFGVVGLIRSLLLRREVAAAIYVIVPTIFYLIIVGDPRTHVYTIVPGAVILAGYGASEIWETIRRRENKVLAFVSMIAAAVWLILVLIYPALMFVDINAERQRTWEDNRPLPGLYPVTWDEPPIYGLFGFPHQAGWRAAMELVPQTAFPYSSNEEEEISNWYMAQRPRTHCNDAETILIADKAQDEVYLYPEWIDGFGVRDVIRVRGEPGLVIYGRVPVDEVGTADASNFQRWLTPEEAAPPRPTGTYPVNATLDGQVRLLGYDLDLSNARPGGKIAVTLYWEALSPISQNKQVFVHLYDGYMWAQHDGAPECAINPTTRWEPGQVVVDPHLLELPEVMEIDKVPLLVGMYDLISNDRMHIDGSGDDFIYLEVIDIIR